MLLMLADMCLQLRILDVTQVFILKIGLYVKTLECVHCHTIKNLIKTMQRIKSKNCDIVDDK